VSSLFTKIINREIPADIVYEDEEIIAFNDINPQAPVHVLIVPKKEIATLNDLELDDQEIIGKMFLTAKKLAVKLNIDKTGYRTVFNCNEHGGQTVFHIHLHLLGGRKLVWPPG
tara:strand:- start:1105 stop:1446 length:342 start_codon:yes stop_codon:yes gene_type:complete